MEAVATIAMFATAEFSWHVLHMMRRVHLRSSHYFVDCFTISAGSIIASVSTSYNASYVLLTPGSFAVINNYILTQGLPNLINETLYNNTYGEINQTYLDSTTAAMVSSGSEYNMLYVHSVIN